MFRELVSTGTYTSHHVVASTKKENDNVCVIDGSHNPVVFDLENPPYNKPLPPEECHPRNNDIQKEETQDKPQQQQKPHPPHHPFRNNPTTQKLIQFTYILPVIKGIIYPIFKIAQIAMAEKLLRAAIQANVDSTFWEELENQVLNASTQPATDFFLMRSLTFYQAFIVTGCLVAGLSVVMPLLRALYEHYLNYQEVKRLQDVLYEKFLMEPNSVAIDEASDLLYTKIASVEKYWTQTKYAKIDDVASLVVGHVLMLIISWDLGLACICGSGLVMVLSSYLWYKLSTPYDQQREDKSVAANAHLVDVVICKEVVLTHAREVQEQKRLHQLLTADTQDIGKLAYAKLVSEMVKTSTFTMITPLLFVFVWEFDLTMDRVFQLLVVIVIADELMRAFLSLSTHAAIEAEYARAKEGFCHVLGMEEEELFPPDFTWRNRSAQEETTEEDDDDDDDDDENNKDFDLDRTERSYTTVMQNQKSRRQLLQKNLSTLSLAIDRAFDNASHGTRGASSLIVKRASFGYKRKDGSILTVIENLNMSLNIGEHYAIMGETGAGKSTFLNALSGLHDPLAGDITFDGDAVDTTSIDWRQKVAVVSQQSVFLNRPLRENLTYGLDRTVSDQEILAALHKVKMKDRVLDLPHGLDTMIEGNGNTFSGGQRQRFQIARLLLSDHPLVLLDECTSALDPTTTEEVLQVLKTHLVGKTMIMITHDADTLVLAQHVLEMKPGGIVEFAKQTRVASIYGRIEGKSKSQVLEQLNKGNNATEETAGIFDDGASLMSELTDYNTSASPPRGQLITSMSPPSYFPEPSFSRAPSSRDVSANVPKSVQEGNEEETSDHFFEPPDHGQKAPHQANCTHRLQAPMPCDCSVTS